jgi:type IX secretion system PorP/SprF family membrane protein
MKKLPKILKKLALIFLLIAVKQMASAQQLPLYSQYLYNKYLINPAHAGSDGYTSLNITAREQWIGYSGAPRTYSISWQTRILKRKYEINHNIFRKTVYRPRTDGRIGLGAYVFSDRNGHIRRTGFQAAYAYHIWLASYTQLSMGLALTGYHFIINASESGFEDHNEPWLTDNLRRGVFVPDADFGIYLLDPVFDVGFSVQQIFGAAAKIGDYAYRNFRMNRHYYLFGSYTYYYGKHELEPSLLFKMSEQLMPQADIGFTYNYDQKIWTGLAYRAPWAVIANIGFRYIPANTLSSAIFVGYSLDFTINQIQGATFGTHEITIALKMGDSRRKFRWLDRY